MAFIIPVERNDKEELEIKGRSLYTLLDISQEYEAWFDRVCNQGKFVEGIDYKVLTTGNELMHYLRLDMAKCICVMEGTEKSKEIRLRIISMEEDWHSPNKVMARAIKLANQTLTQISNENTFNHLSTSEIKDKVNYVDQILNNQSLITISQIAKDYGMSGQKMNQLLRKLKVQYKKGGQWLLYRKYHNKGYTHSQTIAIPHKTKPEEMILHTQWTQKGRLFIYNLLKEKCGIVPVVEKDN